MSPILFPMRFQTRFLIIRNMWENTQTLLLIRHAHGHSLPSLKKTSDTFLLPLFFQSWMWKKRSISLHHKKDSSLTFMTWLRSWSMHGSFIPAQNPKQHLPSSHIFIMVFLFLKIRFTMAVLLSEDPTKIYWAVQPLLWRALQAWFQQCFLWLHKLLLWNWPSKGRYAKRPFQGKQAWTDHWPGPASGCRPGSARHADVSRKWVWEAVYPQDHTGNERTL